MLEYFTVTHDILGYITLCFAHTVRFVGQFYDYQMKQQKDLDCCQLKH